MYTYTILQAHINTYILHTRHEIRYTKRNNGERDGKNWATTQRGGLLEHAAPKKQYTCVNLKVHHQTAPGDELL
jgi:hypothetical protein